MMCPEVDPCRALGGEEQGKRRNFWVERARLASATRILNRQLLRQIRCNFLPDAVIYVCLGG